MSNTNHQPLWTAIFCCLLLLLIVYLLFDFSHRKTQSRTARVEGLWEYVTEPGSEMSVFGYRLFIDYLHGGSFVAYEVGNNPAATADTIRFEGLWTLEADRLTTTVGVPIPNRGVWHVGLLTDSALVLRQDPGDGDQPGVVRLKRVNRE